MDVLKPLVARLDRAATRALEAAAGACVARGHYEVAPEHLLAVLLDDPAGEVCILLRQHLDEVALRRAVTRALEALRAGNPQRPVFAPLLVEWLREAWLIASLECGRGDVHPLALLLALVSHPRRLCAPGVDELIASVPRAAVVKALSALPILAAPGAPVAAGPSGSGEALAKFCTDFTAKAKEGRIDPVFGRDREIRQIVDILARRRKNNPICVGDPGVGKTAVVEGLALRIAEGDVPPNLAGVRLLGLDLGALQAGASVKGEFENRLKAVLEEAKASAQPVVLFIDEAHTLVGAGGSAGTGDAANLLKPALARGELRTIAATTWSEYKKYFEKDAALARRFQPVKLDEPSVTVTVTMLRGLRAHYEKAHGVAIRDDALVAAADLGARYLTGRQHPDKGIDLVDTAAARVKVALTVKPAGLQDAERRIQDLERTLEALARDREAGDADEDGRAAAVETELATLRTTRDALTARWQSEKAAAEAVLAARAALREAAEADKPAQRTALATADAALRASRQGEPLVDIEVTPEVVAKVIADWTGVPVGNLVRDQAQTLLGLEATLGKRIKGQDSALATIAQGIRAAKAGVKDPRQPMGIFLLVGPSGVGKTETATAIADLLFGGERMMTVVNMSEYQEKHSVSRLVGSPPGYVGYGEGGVLTEAVRQRPYSVVLLDEVEKADPDVLNLFYQVFDKGMLSDGEGREVDFKDTVLFLCSNLATDLIMQAGQAAERPPVAELVQRIRPALVRHFKPALLARMTIVPYSPIAEDALREIAALKLGRLARRLKDTHRLEVVVAPEAVAAVAARCTTADNGAREIDHVVAGHLTPLLSTELLARLGEGDLPARLTIAHDATGFVLRWGDAPAAMAAAAAGG